MIRIHTENPRRRPETPAAARDDDTQAKRDRARLPHATARASPARGATRAPRRRHHVHRRDAHVLVPHPQTGRRHGVPVAHQRPAPHGPHGRRRRATTGDAHAAAGQEVGVAGARGGGGVSKRRRVALAPRDEARPSSRHDAPPHQPPHRAGPPARPRPTHPYSYASPILSPALARPLVPSVHPSPRPP